MCNIKTQIIVSWQYEASHCWPNAPKQVEFLRSLHRHVFKCRAWIEVFHDDRELEFIIVKRLLESSSRFLVDSMLNGRDDMSCEEMAKYFHTIIEDNYSSNRDIKIEVLEDGENGALLEIPKQDQES